MNTCNDCGIDENEAVLWIVSADYGTGAFLLVLCEVCDAKRQAAAERLRGQEA